MYRNIGYYSDLQTNLSNYFRSLVFDWILDSNNANTLSVSIDEFKHQLATSKEVNRLGINELTILNKLHNIPIVIFDQYDTVLVVIDGDVKYDVIQYPSNGIYIQYHLTDTFNPKKLQNIGVNKVISVYEI